MGYGDTWDTEMHGIRRYMGYGDIWDTELHGIRRYMGYGATWDMDTEDALPRRIFV